MKITVDYSLLPGLERTGALAPMLPITYRYKNQEFSTAALVDSGAATGLISTVIAEELGIDWQRIPVITGFTLSGSFRFHPIKDLEVEIYGERFFLDLNVIEGISPFKCILGRSDLFKKATVCFYGFKNQFEIEFRELN